MTDRLRFFEHFASAEIFVPLDGEDTATITPQTYETSDGDLAVGFTTEGALADFTGGGAYASLPGRVLASLLSDQDAGLVLDPDTAPQLLTTQDLRWLTETLNQRPKSHELSTGLIHSAESVPKDLPSLLQKRLVPDLMEAVAIAAIDTGTGKQPIVAVIGAPDDTQSQLMQSLQEALIFSDAGDNWAIAFVAAGSLKASQFLQAGVVLKPKAPPTRAQPVAPGSDPDKPPILR